ncbi:hypothetical protein [Streptomyces sp. NPDC005805]|uniref:hypothetical protein n=1 Tax=Streptomyces sp. NPDC005805 TaxID=3157068 RepID=UPI0033DF9582
MAREVFGRTGLRYSVEDSVLNSGGQARLYRCRDGAGRTRVFKEYLRPLTAGADLDQLKRVQAKGTDIVRQAEAAGRLAETAASSVNWPIDIVPAGNGVAGVVLPLIPGDFMRAGGGPNTLDFLSLARVNPPRAEIRVSVLLRVCDIFAFLDDERLLHGDVSAKNLVWRSSPAAHAYLIDSDGLRAFAPAPVHGVCTPGWEDPRLEAGRIRAHDRYSDRFALAVALYKGLFLNPGAPRFDNGRWSGASGFPSGLDGRLRELFRRALDDPLATDGRPGAGEWRDALTAVFLAGSGFHDRPIRVLDTYAQQFRDEFARVVGPGGRPGGGVPGGRAVSPAVVRRPGARLPVGAAARGTPGGPAARPTPPAPAPAPAAARNQRTAPWAWALSLVALVVVGGLVLQFAGREEADRSRTFSEGSAARECPSEVTSGMPVGSRSDAVMLHRYRTSRHEIVVCRTADEELYYHGALRNRPDAKTMTVPATETGTGYRAANGDYLYEIDGDEVRVTLPSGSTRSYELTEVTGPDFTDPG